MRDPLTSKVLVQTEGDIVLRLDRRIPNGPYGTWLMRVRFLLSVVAAVGCGLLVGLEAGRHGEPSRQEAMLLQDVERLQDRVQSLLGAADRQIQRADTSDSGLETKLEDIKAKIAGLSESVEAVMAQRRDSTPVFSPIDPAVDPRFQMIYLTPGFLSDMSTKSHPAVVASQKLPQVAQKTESATHQHRRPTILTSDDQDRQADPSLDAPSAPGPVDESQAGAQSAP